MNTAGTTQPRHGRDEEFVSAGAESVRQTLAFVAFGVV